MKKASKENRSDRIRTCDLIVPNDPRYQLRHTPRDQREFKKFKRGSDYEQGFSTVLSNRSVLYAKRPRKSRAKERYKALQAVNRGGEYAFGSKERVFAGVWTQAQE